MYHHWKEFERQPSRFLAPVKNKTHKNHDLGQKNKNKQKTLPTSTTTGAATIKRRWKNRGVARTEGRKGIK